MFNSAINLPFYDVQVSFLSQPDDRQPIGKPIFDPLDALQLRVNHQRPLDRVCQDGRVLRRHVVRRQALVVPLRDQSVVGQEREDVCADVAEGKRNRLLEFLEEGQPLSFEQFQAILFGEAAQVGNKRGDQQHVSRQHFRLKVNCHQLFLK